MSRFAIRTPYLIIVCGLIILVLGVSSVARMPVDMFPSMNVPVVVVATFYPGMPPEQIEGNITYHLERFFTLASGIDHIESRSLNGVSIIRVYFQPETNADADAAMIANFAVSDMKDLPPGTFPPVVLKSDASSLPVCLVSWCRYSSAVWRPLASDSVLRRSLQDGSTATEPDGRGACPEPVEPGSACRRRHHWQSRL
jgi:multidrug efflux pump subunit AcrB